MNLVWQDNLGSFLDSLATNASGSFASFLDDGSAALWSASPDGGAVSGSASLLWSGDTGSSTEASLFASAGLDASGTLLSFDSSGADAGLLWAHPGGNTSVWSVNDSWMVPDSTALAPNAFGSLASSTMSPPEVLWTSMGAGQSPVLPLTADPHLTSFAGSTSPSAGLLASLTPQQLVWTDAPGVPSFAAQPSIAGSASTTLPTSFGGLAQASSGPFSLMAGQPQATA